MGMWQDSQDWPAGGLVVCRTAGWQLAQVAALSSPEWGSWQVVQLRLPF